MATHELELSPYQQTPPTLLAQLPSFFAQVSFLRLLTEAFQDFTIIVLLVAGGLSIGLEATLGKEGDNGWIEGAAILAAVAVVVLVTAVNNYQKEKQFRELSALAEAGEVRAAGSRRMCGSVGEVEQACAGACACAHAPGRMCRAPLHGVCVRSEMQLPMQGWAHV